MVKKEKNESAVKVIDQSIQKKINSYINKKVCKAADLDVLITERPPKEKIFQPYKKIGIEIL